MQLGHLRACGLGVQHKRLSPHVCCSRTRLTSHRRTARTATEQPGDDRPLVSESQAVYTATPEQVQQPYAQAPQYYQARPPTYPVQPLYAPPPPTSGTAGLPWWLLVGGGVLLGSVLGKLQEMMKKGPQQMMAEMAMKQMMSQMGAGAAGKMPPGFPSPPSFGSQNPYIAGNPFASGFPQPPAGGFQPQGGATVDATATQVQQPPRSDSGRQDSSGRPGEKFSQRWNGSSNTSSSNGASGKPADNVVVVEPTVSEPWSGSASTSGFKSSTHSSDSTAASSSKPPPQSSFFTDIKSDSTKANPFANASESTSGTQSSDEDAEGMSVLLERMLRNPGMQKMLYPYLPENMRNPESIEWMLSTPEVKKSMETMFAQQNISPQMLAMMKNVDLNQDKVDQQFKELGMKPEDVMSKVMSNPELAAGFSIPKVQAAIIDISANPLNITKYAGDAEIMKILNEVSQIFKPDIAPERR